MDRLDRTLRNRRLLIALVGVACTLIAWAATARAGGVWFVSTAGADTNDCLTMTTACRTIVAALQKAASGDIIIVADGVYTGSLLVDKDVTLVGFGADATTILGDGLQRVLTVTAGVVADLSNVSIVDGVGLSPQYPGGIWISGTLRLSRSVVSGDSPGGILNFGVVEGHWLVIRNSTSSPLRSYRIASLNNSTIESNRAGISNYGTFQLNSSHVLSNTRTGSPGGGIANYGIMMIEGSVIRANAVQVESGGGIYNQGQLSISNTLIISNTAYSPPPPPGSANPEAVTHSWGGGIFNYLGTLTVTNSTLFGSSASSGGDQFSNYDGVARFTNVTLRGDDGHRGMQSGHMTVTNVTISDMPSGITASPFVVASNTIISNTYCTGAMTSLGYNLDSGNTCGFTATGDLTNTNPLLGPLQDNGGPTPTYALLPGSPAVNAGDNSTCPATDQRGVPRPQAGRCDIGAYEYVFPVETYLPFVAR